MAAIAMSSTGPSYDVLYKPADGYQCGDQHVIRCQNDELLAFAYSKFKKQGLLSILFYEHQYSMLQFIAKYLENNTSTLACFLKQGDEFILKGIGWINERVQMGDYARAGSGMAFFRREEGDPSVDLVRYGQMMIEWAFDHLDIDVMHGSTPAENRAAVLFSKKCGFQVIGPLEGGTIWNGGLCDVYLSSMTTGRWLRKRPWKDGE